MMVRPRPSRSERQPPMSSELIFLVHPDEGTRDRLSTVLHESGFKVLTAGDEASALRSLSQMRFVLPDALITPLSENGPLLEKLRQNPLTADLPVLVLSDHPADDRRRALRQGISDLLPAPFDGEELLLTLRLALQRSAERRHDSRSLRGSIALLPLVDLLQTLEAGRRSGVLDVRSNGRHATLWLRQGQPIDAQFDDGRRGEEAVYAMLRFDDGTFEVEFGDVTVPQRISTSLSGLLLEGLRRIDESAHEVAVPHAALPDQPPLPPPEVMAAHRALTLLNVAGAYAASYVQPALLVSAFEEARRALLTELPELAVFHVGAEGQVSLPSTIPHKVLPGRMVLAAAMWARRLFERLDRALPGRFDRTRLVALTDAVRDDMQSLGFDDALGVERSTPEENQ